MAEEKKQSTGKGTGAGRQPGTVRKDESGQPKGRVTRDSTVPNVSNTKETSSPKSGGTGRKPTNDE